MKLKGKESSPLNAHLDQPNKPIQVHMQSAVLKLWTALSRLLDFDG